MGTWPVRNQKAPAYWDDQLRGYIDDADEALGLLAGSAGDTADEAKALADALDYLTASGRLSTTAVNTTIDGRVLPLVATKSDALGSNLSRFLNRARAGEDVKIVAIGDSILEGTTVTADGGVLGVDDTLPRVAAAVAARFGNTVTKVNHALSGHTVAMGPLSAKWTAAVNEAADLYIIDYGTNDLSADLTSLPVPGYKMADSVAGLERLFRRIRTEVPKADIAFLIANPYNGGIGAGSNPAKVAYNKRVRSVCAYYGVEVIDGFQAFADFPGGYASLMADTTHPNTAGHTVLAAEVMKHLPANFQGPSAGPATVPVRGLYTPEDYDPAVGDTGVQSVLVPTFPMWVETGGGGGWSASGSARVSTTVGNAITGTGNFTELYVMMSTLTSDGLRATLTVDGVTRFTDTDLTTGKQGTYWVPIATDLPATTHTYVLTITAGTAKISRVGWLSGPVAIYNVNQTWQDIAAGSVATAVSDTGSITYLDPSSAASRITWPAGWRSAKVEFSGYVNSRVSAVTTTARRLQIVVRLNGVAISTHQVEIPASAAGTYFPSISISSPAVDITANRLVAVEASIISTDKTNCQVLSWAVQAHLTRLT